MRTKVLLCLVFIAGLLLACTGTPPGEGAAASAAPITAANTAADADAAAISLLVGAQGTVQLKRREWSAYYRTDFGSLLEAGDLLQIEDDGRAVILCDGLRTRQIPVGSPVGLNNLCPPAAEKILVRGGVFLGNTRGGSDPMLPYLISPRNTRVLTTTPVLRWNAVPGATGYTVTVKGPGVEWQTTVTTPTVTYPGDPALARGQTYSVVIATDTGASSQDEGVPGLGFTVVDAPAAERIEQNIARIMALEIDAEGKQLALSQYLVGEGLVAESIDILASLVHQAPDSPFPYRMLGDRYRQSGLNLPALAAYETALQLADGRENLEAGALAREGLADVSLALGERDTAATLLREAAELYRRLGDAVRVDAITQRLAANGL